MGFVSYLRGLFPDSFQTTKRHSYNDYSTYMPSFVQFLPAVYPVGMTDLRPFLTQKIDNSVNLNRIPTKIGTEMRFNKPYTCTKFQPNRSMFSQVMAENAKCAKWEKNKKKTKKLVWNFARSYLGIDWRDLATSNLICRFA